MQTPQCVVGLFSGAKQAVRGLERTDIVDNYDIIIVGFPKFACQPEWLGKDACTLHIPPEACPPLFHPPNTAPYVDCLDFVYTYIAIQRAAYLQKDSY